jgi:hypothetical protein
MPSPLDERTRPLPLATWRLLARRLISAVGEPRLDPADEAWAASLLTPAERDLWATLPPHDRSHSVEVARRVERRLAPTVHSSDTRWLAAALMHDVGKARSDLSTRERVMAALASKTVRLATARRWASHSAGVKRRIGAYLIHGEIGAEMIRAAGGREAVAAWTEVHQGYVRAVSPEIPSVVARALIESDVARG